MNLAQNFPRNRRTFPRFPLVLITLAAAFSLGASAHASSILADGGFEAAGGGSVYYAGQSIDGGSWTVTQGAVYIDNLDPWVYDGANSLNLTGANLYAANSVDQILTTVVGQFYTVNFWANADISNSFSLTENGFAVSGASNSIAQNGFSDQIDALGNSAHFVDYTGYFYANSTSTDVRFTATGNPSIGSDNYSVIIDDVSVTPTPEPGSILLMLTGFLALALLMGKKRLGQSASATSLLA
jgi:hypothetical protein